MRLTSPESILLGKLQARSLGDPLQPQSLGPLNQESTGLQRISQVKKKRKKGQRDKNQPLINEVLNNIVPAGKAKEDGFDSKDKGGETGDNKDKTNSSNTDES